MNAQTDTKATDAMSILAPVFDAPIERFILPSGMTVIHRMVPGGLAAVQLWVKTGSIHESPYLGSGMSHYLEHMLFKGTARRSAPELTAAVQAVGGDINAYTTFDRTVYHIEAPSEGFHAAMDVLHDMAFHSLLDPAELAREREVILREIAMNNDDPDRQLVRRLYETAFREHPYRQPVIGHDEQFRRIAPETLHSYYKARYTPDNMVLIVVGDVHLETLELALENTFAKEPRAQLNQPVIPGEPPQLAPRIARMNGDVSICRGSMAYRVPGMGHADAPALDMLAAIIGGGDSSILCQSLRMRRQIVSDIESSCWNPGKKGLFWISYTSDCGTAEKVEAAVLEELEVTMRRGFSRDDLDRARRMTLTGEIDSRKTVSGHASRLGISEVVVGDLFYPRQYFLTLDRLTTKDLVDAAARYLNTNTLTRVSLDAEGFPSKNRSSAAFSMPSTPEVFTLSCGAKIICQPDRTLPKVHLRFGALGGPCYESDSNAGATSLLATLLTRDTKARSAENVSKTIEGAGGRLDDFCGNNSFGVAMELLSSELEVGLEILEQALLRPDFRAGSFEVERAGQIARIQEAEDDITDRGRALMRRAFFRDHPYARQSNGTTEALGSMSIRDIEAHYARLMRSENAVISICGDIDVEKTATRMESILKSLNNAPFTRSEIPFSGPEPAEISACMDREQTVLFRSFSGPGVRAGNYIVSEIL
ncbi:MAG TPA: insulinase family protein, partial [Opitutales bacterium]|nr:insulinase family protein [Opitutales bacterium]